MFELKNISCGYGKKLILSDVNLTIKPGELTCLLGKNGAGKTTLFKTLLGMLVPIRGMVLLNNKPLKKFSSKELARLVSYVPQAHGSPFPFTAFDVVLMGQFAYSEGCFRLPGNKNRQVATESIRLLGIEELKNKYFSTLSGGEKQLVLIARAMAQQPLFIAMDEPTSNLDLGNQAKVMKITAMLKAQGYGIIMNTHAPEQALNDADQVVLLQNGTIRATGHPGQVMNSQLISEVYNTSVELALAQTANGITRQVCLAT